MNKYSSIKLRQILCSPRCSLFAASVLAPLLGFLVLRKAPALLPLVMLGLGVGLAGLLAGVLRRSERALTAAKKDLTEQVKDRQHWEDAIAAQQMEMEGGQQSMAATNALLAQASGRFQELFQGLPAACVCFDTNGQIMEWNRAFEQLYALPVAWGESVWETVYAQADNPDAQDMQMADAVAAVLEGECQQGIERTYRRPDGSSVSLYCSIFPLRGVDGEITGAISAEIDISAQHQAEEALRHSEERLHTLYNVTSQQELSFEEKTTELLTLAAAQFGLDVGVLGQVNEDRYEVIQAISPGGVICCGTILSAGDTYCQEALKLADTVSFEEAGATDRRTSAAYRAYGLEAYLGTPVRVNGEVWGMLCFAGFQPHPRLFTSGDRELLRLMSQWIGSEIARRQADDAIHDSEERFRTAIAAISEGLIVVNAAGVITLWNDSAERILERTSAEMHGLRPLNPDFEAIREDGTKFPQGSYPLIASLRRGEPQQDIVMGLPRQGRKTSQTGQGEMLWVSVNAKPLYQPGAEAPYAIVATFTDITERRRSADQITRQMLQITEYASVLEQQKVQLEEVNDQLEVLAMHDSLTGLGNRRAFEQRMAQEAGQARRYGTPLSILLMDVDSFKSYNDTYGHPAGDEVLRILAKVIRTQGRETDFFARYGGEEFIIILPQTDADGASVLAERLRAAVEKADWPERAMTASLGAATLLPSMPDEESLVAAADQALYAAKNAGRNCVLHALSLPETLLPSVSISELELISESELISSTDALFAAL
jgi:diguanylate cyclase (GGDEF)-like protein/PAS domain S-box-containing protein